ncbi:unnamed protein product [Cuscuta europaea]|uniref:Uncharacterized protein n=1 Tax=Cuscuta europaea TaxID=41803 RepID=A0A9P1E0U1_CUSEU|nr:unnamed protein product [Cuscuta europaea]
MDLRAVTVAGGQSLWPVEQSLWPVGQSLWPVGQSLWPVGQWAVTVAGGAVTVAGGVTLAGVTLAGVTLHFRVNFDVGHIFDILKHRSLFLSFIIFLVISRPK